MTGRQAIPEPLLEFVGESADVAAALTRVDALKVRFDSENANGRILQNAVEAIRIELTYHSNAIEGNTLTLRETQLVIEGRTPEGGKPLREIYEARNHDRALRLIETWVHLRPADTAISERDLLDIHAQVLHEIDTDCAGRYRSERVLIAGSRYIPHGPHRFEELIPQALALANRGNVHPVLQAAELHYNTVAIHPFRDGNGRTARLLMNFHLLGREYPLTVIEVSQRGEYLAALDEANAGHFAHFALFICGCVEKSIKRLITE